MSEEYNEAAGTFLRVDLEDGGWRLEEWERDFRRRHATKGWEA